MTVNPFFLHPQPATKTTATNSKKIMMKHLLKVLLLVNFEFQGILNNSLGGGGVTCGDLASRLEEVKTCSSLDPRISRLPVPLKAWVEVEKPWERGWICSRSPSRSKFKLSTLSAFISYNFSCENLVLGQRIYPCGYPFHCISGRKSINIEKRNSFLVTCVSERIR